MVRWLSLASVVVALDQLTKYWVVTRLALSEKVQVLPFFYWVHWQNDGAAFSFLSGSGGWQRWFFITLAVVFVSYIIYELARLPKQERVMGWVFGLILGGALGNLTDRVMRDGFVVDFIRFEYGEYGFPAFNLADSALFCGAALWIWMMIREQRTAKTVSEARGE